jgi:type IX secretion system PorP/SprF family membrane protein
MMKTTGLILILLIASVTAYSQQDPMYSQYVFNGLLINPAYAGTHDALNATLLYRNQWVNISGAPKTGLFAVDAPVKSQKIGVGLNVEYDKIGVTSHTGISGAYAYQIPLLHGKLSFGLQVGVGFSKSDFTSVQYSQDSQVDEAFEKNIFETLPNFGIGLYYYNDRFYAGYSVPQIAGKVIQNLIYENSEGVHLDLANHHFLTAGYKFNLSPDMAFKPSVLLKYVTGAPLETDLNGIVTFYDILALGISYRSGASMDFLAQVKISNQFCVGYAYEYATNDLNTFSNGSHEIMLQYLFNFTRNKLVTPRFF